MPSIHENIKALRLARGRTQESVAGEMHVTRQTISSYESGRTQPDLETLKRLAAVLEADLDDILYGGSRRQKRMRRLRCAAWLLAAAFVLGLLAHSALLWAMNSFFEVTPGPGGEESRVLLEQRFALRNAADRLASFWALALSLLSVLVFAFLVTLGSRVPLRSWAKGGLIVALGAVVAVLPFARSDSVYAYADYLLPLLRLTSSALLLGAGLIVANVRHRPGRG